MQQPIWDQYETALLIEACEKLNNDIASQSDVIKEMSSSLRNRAIARGNVVDDIFRNENGIQLQLTKMNYLLTEGKKGLPGASKFFAEMAALWKNDKTAFNSILFEAQKQIKTERVESKNMGNYKDEFCNWLCNQEKLKYSPEHILFILEEGSQYAQSHSISKVPFFEITDDKKFSNMCLKLLSQRIFRLMHKQTAQDLDKCYVYYKTFLIEKAEKSNASANITMEKSPLSDTDDTKQDLKDGITISDKLFIFLKSTSDNNPYGTTLTYLANQVGISERAAKDILSNAEWAILEYGRYKFNYSANKGSQKYNFTNPPSLAYTRPISATYFDDNISNANSWRQLYIDVMGVLYDDYPHCFEEIIGKTVSSATLPLVVGEADVQKFRVPKSFADGLYVETNRSAKDIMANLKHMLDICCVDYENLCVLYEQKSDLLEQKSNEESSSTGDIIQKSSNDDSTIKTKSHLVDVDFFKWLKETEGLVDSTCRSYVSAVHQAEQFARQNQYSEWQICDVAKEKALSVISTLLKDESFILYNREQHNRFTAAFNKLTAFYECSAKEMIDESISDKYPQLYAKLYSASKVYDDPAGMELQRICKLIGSIEYEAVKEILKVVSWAAEVDAGKFSFSKNAHPVIRENKSVEPDDFDKDKYIETLLRRYRNGMTFDSIDFDNFRDMYDDLFDETIAFNDDELETRLRYCGVVFKDRLFPAEGIIDNETKEKLFSYIETSFASGKSVLYYKAIFEDLADDFASCFTLSDEEMLKAFIEFTAPKNQYYFFKDYMSKEKNVAIDHAAEVSNYLLSAGKPMNKDEVCAALSHIPQDKVNHIIEIDPRFLRNSKGEYFHADIFEITDSELEKIAGFITEDIEENEYAIWTDIWSRIQDEMQIFLENNLYLSSLGIRNAIAKRYSGRFYFNGAVISAVGKNYAMRDVYQLFAKHHDTFTSDEIYNLSKELDTVIYYEALAEVSVRVNHNLFVSKKSIHFDADVIDKCIDSFISGDYIRIREIDSFLTFPSVGYEWNEYMLESYLISFSKKYLLLNNGMALDNVAGVIVKKGGKISEFVDACAAVLAVGEVELKKDTALDYLASVNMITRRSYSDIDTAIKTAKQIRTRKG